ncbi:MAG: hypothetical protein C5B52_01060 [Bacteroidetes bacterium]|nr:MAG: hypothetical protein C5B52_01060 [Bacteroidota bacterium]
MRKILLQPFPLSESYSARFRTAVYFGIFVSLFLLIFRPFGIETGKFSSTLLVACYYGLICFSTLVICLVGIRALFPSWFVEARWTVWKEILFDSFCVILVASGNIVFSLYHYHATLRISYILNFLWITFTVGFLPLSIMILLRQMKLTRSYTKDAEGIESSINVESIQKETYSHQKIEIISSNEKENFSLYIDDLLFIESADNYVKIIYLDKGSIQQKVIRNSLRNLEEQLSKYSAIYRCHRTYLVNLQKVIHASGNAQGIKLHLEGTNELIPVSRSLTQEIKQKIAVR